MGDDDRETKEEFPLGELVYAEIKKAFAICDRDGNGYLDVNEVKEAMQSIMQHTPSASEIQQFMNLVDKDKNGKVSFEEFLQAVSSWLKDDKEQSTSNGNSSKKRKIMDSERHELHKKIKGFFQQFEQSPLFDDIRKRMAGGGVDVMQLDYIPGEELSSVAKVEFLEKHRVSMDKDVDSISFGLKSGQLQLLLPSVSTLYQLLRIVEVFYTPAQRRSVADDVLRIFSLILTQGFVEPLVKCLYYEYDELRLLSLNCLRLIAPGPSIASTPSDHILHPDKLFFKRISFLTNPNPKIRERALAFIYAFAEHHPDCRDTILQHNALPAILSMASLGQQKLQNLHSPSPSSAVTNDELAKVVRTLVVLLGVSHPITKVAPWSLLSTALPDVNILVPVLAAARFMFPGVPEVAVCRRLVELISTHPSPRVKKAALRTIDAIFKYDKQQSEILLVQCNIMATLHNLLSINDVALRSTTCDTLGLVAHFYPGALIQASTIPIVLSQIHSDEHLRTQYVNIIKWIARSNQKIVDYLVKCDAVKSLCRAFAYFKSYDEVLLTEYKYTGAVYSFEFIDKLIEILDLIVSTGEAMASSMNAESDINEYALLFDAECVDKIRTFLTTIKEGLQHYGKLLNAWREKGINKPINFTEERTKYLLHTILEAHKAKTSSTNSDEAQKSQLVVNIILEIGQSFYTPTALEKILFECTYNGDTRMISVDANITYTRFKSMVEQKYEITKSTLTYIEKESSMTIDSNENLHFVFEKSKESGAKLIKVNVSANVTTPQVRKTSPGGLHANLTHSPSSPFKKPTLAPLLTPLDLDAISMDLHNLEVIRAQERKVLLESLAQTTHFGTKELEGLFNAWARQASDGFLARPQFVEGLSGIGVTDPLTVESYWHAFDIHNDGKVNFRQFVTSLGILKRGSLEEKLQFAFRAYDKDNSGYIDRVELADMVKAGLTAQNRAMNPKELKQAVEECFSVMDVNKDDKLSYEEFSQAIMQQPPLVKLFVPSIPGLL